MDKRKPTLIQATVSENSANLQLKVDADILDFQGHFNHFPLLPGVTQVDWVLHFAIEHLNVPSAFKGMEVIKFQEPILPNSEVSLDLTWDETKQKLAFKYFSHRDESTVVHSSGKMKLAQPSQQNPAEQVNESE